MSVEISWESLDEGSAHRNVYSYKDKTDRENAHTATTRDGFEPMIPLFERYQRAGVSEQALSN
jgi:hypothetical protein